MKTVPLTQGKVALVDDEDYERVSAYPWCALQAKSGEWYARRRRSTENPYLTLHRFVMNAAPAETIDHENGSGLDCQKANLRRCTRLQNSWNRRADRRSKTGFKGVHYFAPTRKWQAHIRVRNKKIHLGYFPTAEDAARAYDVAARQHFGEFARPNFPEREVYRAAS